MARRACLIGALIFLVAIAQGSPRAAGPQSATPPADQRALLNEYCVTCHNEKLKTAGLALDKLDLANPAGDAEPFEKVIRKVRAGMMPPQGKPRPTEAAANSLVSWLESSLDQASGIAKPNPGRPLLRR